MSQPYVTDGRYVESIFVEDLLYGKYEQNESDYYYVGPYNVWFSKVCKDAFNDRDGVCKSVCSEEYPKKTDNYKTCCNTDAANQFVFGWLGNSQCSFYTHRHTVHSSPNYEIQ